MWNILIIIFGSFTKKYNKFFIYLFEFHLTLIFLIASIIAIYDNSSKWNNLGIRRNIGIFMMIIIILF